MTKLDWEDDEDFMDYPHLALELPSESSLSKCSRLQVYVKTNIMFCMHKGPDGGWNPIDELSLPYDSDVVHEPAVCIEANTNDSFLKQPSSIAKNDVSMKSSFSEQELNLHQNNLSIWKDKKDVPWENIKKLTTNDSCDNINEIDCNTEIKHNESSENIIHNNRKIINDEINDDLSLTSEQFISDIAKVKNNVIPQHSPNLVLELNNSEVYENNEIYQRETNVNFEKSTNQDTLVNSQLECVDIEESSNQTNCVQNVLLEDLKNDVSDTDTPNGMYAKLVDNPVNNNNNNNTMIKNDQEEYTDFCDFKTDLPHSLNEPLPNRTSQECHDIENPQIVDQHDFEKLTLTQINDEHYKVLTNISILDENKIEQNVESINPNCSTFQYNEINVEHNSDSEFDEFSDFHVFSNSTTKNKSICDSNDNDDFCKYETRTHEFNDTVEFKHSDVEQVKFVTSNYNDSMLKSENQNSIINNDDDDDDNFCDFESGYSTSSLHTSDQAIDLKQSYALLDSESHVQLDYKQFCKDAFQGDYVSLFCVNYSFIYVYLFSNYLLFIRSYARKLICKT